MRRFSQSLLILAASTPALAQSFNIDVGTQPTYSPVPSSAFGAAASQPGAWNAVNGATAGPCALVDLTGAATSVTVSRTGSSSAYTFDNAATTGDDAALMDDGYDPSAGSGSATWTFAGLAAGSYRIFTYAWAPDNSTHLTRVAVAGSPDGAVAVGGWPSPFKYVASTANYPPVPSPTTHAVHHITISTGGSISVTISVALNFGALNGFQLVKDPTVVGFCEPDAGVMDFLWGSADCARAWCTNAGSPCEVSASAGLANVALEGLEPAFSILVHPRLFSRSTFAFCMLQPRAFDPPGALPSRATPG